MEIMRYNSWQVFADGTGAVPTLEAAGIPPLMARVLAARGLGSPEEARAFLTQGLEQLNDPALMPDMEKGAERVHRAIEAGETIAIYGDYDVDGITSLALLARTFKDHGVECLGYIPDRVEEGYGMNREAVDRLHEAGATLIITVDCGITAVEEVAYAATLGVDVVITDHHECKEVLPAAVAVINPKRADCTYPFKEFAGIGVAYKFLCAIFPEYREKKVLNKYAPLVALGTVADVMPLVKENRVVVQLGLEQARNTEILGLRKLMDACGLRGKDVTSSHVSYVLAPKLNAAGRMGRVRVATDLLITEDEEEADRLVEELLLLNRERQKTENDILREATAMLAEAGAEPGRAVVLAGENWHQGVIGIVASRVAEKIKAPTFMISMSGDMGKASCRSYGGFNLFRALEQVQDLLESFGGHALAAGFVIRRENIPALRERMEELFAAWGDRAEQESVLQVDALLEDTALLTLPGIGSLEELEPFGTGNPTPVFCIRDMEVDSVSDVGGGRHMRLTLLKNGRSCDAIFFSHSSARMGIVPGDTVDVAFTPEVNEFRGRRSVQLQVKDICQCARTREKEREELALYDRFRRGESISRPEAERLLPTRAFFVGTWRYLRTHTDGEISGERGYLARCIAQAAGREPSAMRAMICLDCFRELGLIEETERHEELTVLVREAPGKVDLSRAPSLMRLNDCLRNS